MPFSKTPSLWILKKPKMKYYKIFFFLPINPVFIQKLGALIQTLSALPLYSGVGEQDIGLHSLDEKSRDK